ncbi:vgr related protein [Sphingomonas sp.]|uniref:vgr related protein n=1 Tax=Sphingomonas sp. TaxID=28214 RepID=UPI0025D44F1D|nr:vgr related protein [Sphingomonas sp.]
MSSRPLTAAEAALAFSVFGQAIDYDRVRLHNAKWIFFHPRHTAMAPDGDIWFHPGGDLYCADFCEGHLSEQGLFIHEMTHVWQAHRSGRWWLPMMRHPFCRYDYTITPGKPFGHYGIEQQAEIVRHAVQLRHGGVVAGKPGTDVYEALLPFRMV